MINVGMSTGMAQELVRNARPIARFSFTVGSRTLAQPKIPQLTFASTSTTQLTTTINTQILVASCFIELMLVPVAVTASPSFCPACLCIQPPHVRSLSKRWQQHQTGWNQRLDIPRDTLFRQCSVISNRKAASLSVCSLFGLQLFQAANPSTFAFETEWLRDLRESLSTALSLLSNRESILCYFGGTSWQNPHTRAANPKPVKVPAQSCTQKLHLLYTSVTICGFHTALLSSRRVHVCT